jgi:hypothetical protein
MSNIPTGLVYLNLLQRNGAEVSYSSVFRSTMVLQDFQFLDDEIFAEIKNFGEDSLPQIKSETFIVTVEDYANSFPNCQSISIRPTKVNGVDYPSNAKRIVIPFESILGINPVYTNPFLSSPVNIYALTGVVNDSVPNVYEVPYSLYELWYYIKNCEFPPTPPYYNGKVLGGDLFLNL